MKTIPIRNNDGTLTLQASVVAFSIDQTFALHRHLGFVDDPDDSWGWTITHVPTGLGIFAGVRRRKDAEKAMDLLVQRFGKQFRRIKPTKNVIARNVTPLVKSLLQGVGAIRPAMHVVPSWWRDVPSELVSN